MSTIKERWNELCFLLSEGIKKDISEQMFEQQVVQALLVLEWKRSAGDFEIRPSLPIGAAQRITPDFVVKSGENQNLFVIEIKQPAQPLALSYQNQLFSYMRQLKADFGILIGQSIQLFYDGPLLQQNKPLLLDTIKFERDNAKGELFVELFSKDSFSEQALTEYAKQVIYNINRKQQAENLLNLVTSSEYQVILKGLIRQDLLAEYDAGLINSVLEDVHISLQPKEISNAGTFAATAATSAPTQKNNDAGSGTGKLTIKINNNRDRDNSKYIYRGKTYAKNRLVLAVITDYVQENPAITYGGLKAIFPDSLQGQETFATFTSARQRKDRRHFYESDEVIQLSDETIAVSTQWGLFNLVRFLERCEQLGIKIDKAQR